MSIETRAAVLRPALERLGADILCLQEVNAQHVAGVKERRLVALDRLLAGTRYQHYARASTTSEGGVGPADVHNLVTLSRFPIVAQREIRPALNSWLHCRSQLDRRGCRSPPQIGTSSQSAPFRAGELRTKGHHVRPRCRRPRGWGRSLALETAEHASNSLENTRSVIRRFGLPTVSIIPSVR